MSAGGLLVQHFKFSPGSLVWLPNSAAEERLRANPLVTSVVPNRRVFRMEGLTGLWPQDEPIIVDGGGGADTSTQRIPRGVSRVGASPGFVSFTGSGVGVAVMDTGVNGQHRDFRRADGSRVVSNICFKETSVPSCDSDVAGPGGHGTAVAGVIAAVNNNFDLVGAAPDSTIYNVNVFRMNDTECPGTFCATDFDLVFGLEWIIQNHNVVSPPIQVLNVSLGRRADLGANDFLEDAFNRLAALDIVTVVAAGNWPTLGNDPTLEVSGVIPAKYSSVMAIASTTGLMGSDDGSICSIFPHVPEDTASWFTVDGRFDLLNGGVTVSAPGADKEDIVRTPGQCALLSVGVELLTREGGVGRGSGTSFSSPAVAGVVALMKQKAQSLGIALTKLLAQDKIRATANRRLDVPLDSTHRDYSFDGEREGIAWAPGALQALQ